MLSAKEEWKKRKKRYLKHLRTADSDVLLVSLADKLHNARAILLDYRTLGDPFWDRFRSGAGPAVRWYYRELSAAFEARRADLGPAAEPALDEFARTVETIEQLSG